MRRCIPFLAGFLFACGGSSSERFVASPEGGGGQVADYAGSYSGAFDESGTMTLAIGEDGTVSGTRSSSAWPTEQTLAGTIDGNGGLTLTVNGIYPRTERGFLLKRPGGQAFALTTESGYGDIEMPHTFALTGGKTQASQAPATTGRAFSNLESKGARRYEGVWRRGETTGKALFHVEPSGRVRGRWEGEANAVFFNGRLADWNATPEYRTFLAGSVQFVRSERTLELRLLDLPVFLAEERAYLEGLAFDSAGGEPYRFSIHRLP